METKEKQTGPSNYRSLNSGTRAGFGKAGYSLVKKGRGATVILVQREPEAEGGSSFFRKVRN